MALTHVMALASCDELRVHLLNVQPAVTGLMSRSLQQRKQ
jgi:hypothetical protein